jgi:signal transduction histidine kinase
VEISLKVETGTLVVRVADNGHGFVPTQAGQGTSFGLIGMHERVLALAGSLEIQSAPGQGTTLIAKIPWADPPRPAQPA